MEKDEFSEDFERLKEMKNQQEERLREARAMVKELERAVTKINGQLEFIQYRRTKAAEEKEEEEKKE